jgi:hypothetical protein
MSKLRFNANEKNSKVLRDFQAMYKKAKGVSPSLESLANVAIDLGTQQFTAHFGTQITGNHNLSKLP